MSNPEWWLDPPDLPTYGDCDRCGDRYYYDDMWERNGLYYCEDCFLLVKVEEEVEENEN
jgi:hypothetical protein